MFDQKTIEALEYYVYLLIDPITNTPFYVGKGTGNRVFAHINDAKEGKNGTPKLDEIRSILDSNKKIVHVIVRHGLKEKVAFQIEAALIDTFKFIPVFKTFVRGNIQGGINSIENGLMTSNEIKRKYNAEKLDFIAENCIIININGSYKNASGNQRIYQATKETWRMSDPRNGKIKYVLSEFKGYIVEVFKIEEWYALRRPFNKGAKKYGQSYTGYGFNGVVASALIRDRYINKSIAHKKRPGASNPIIYNL